MRGYLRGLFQTDGTVNTQPGADTCSVRLELVHRPLLREVQRLLANFGVCCRAFTPGARREIACCRMVAEAIAPMPAGPRTS